jgi:hypothetical protein
MRIRRVGGAEGRIRRSDRRSTDATARLREAEVQLDATRKELERERAEREQLEATAAEDPPERANPEADPHWAPLAVVGPAEPPPGSVGVVEPGQTPTAAQFSSFQALYEHFNGALFASTLPPVLLNFSRKVKTPGFFAPERWENGRARSHEISLSARHLTDRPPSEVAATLVHEMCHLWQFVYGEPSRPGYHNA